jgi:hypothetical protein
MSEGIQGTGGEIETAGRPVRQTDDEHHPHHVELAPSPRPRRAAPPSSCRFRFSRTSYGIEPLALIPPGGYEVNRRRGQYAGSASSAWPRPGCREVNRSRRRVRRSWRGILGTASPRTRRSGPDRSEVWDRSLCVMHAVPSRVGVGISGTRGRSNSFGARSGPAPDRRRRREARSRCARGFRPGAEDPAPPFGMGLVAGRLEGLAHRFSVERDGADRTGLLGAEHVSAINAVPATSIPPTAFEGRTPQSPFAR